MATDAGAVGASGEHERRLAGNYLARQGAQLVGVAVGLGVAAVLARQLSLSAFGTYGLLLSLTAYLIVIQSVVEVSAIKAIAEAPDQAARDRAFSTALVVYSGAGILAGALVAGLGAALLQVWSVPGELRGDAWRGIAALTVVTWLSWPLRTFYDTLRGAQRFGAVAAAEISGLAISGGLVVGLAVAGAPLWLVVSAAAAGSLLTGASSALLLGSLRLPYRFRRRALGRATTRSFLRLSGYLFLAGLADFVIFSLDRTILGSFRSAATVGLYEGPVRAHNLVRDVQATVASPVLPAAAEYHARGDAERMRQLLLRGSRYTVAVVTPLALVLMVLARPLLEAWLGEPFGAGATALTILVGFWIVYANTSVGWQMTIAVGQVARFARFTVSVALANVALALILTPILGLNGVVLGTAIPYVVGTAVFLRLVLPEFGVSLAEFAREVWLPAYATALVVAGGLLALRLGADLATLPVSAAAAIAGVLIYWAIYYAAWLRPNERLLVRDLVRRIARR